VRDARQGQSVLGEEAPPLTYYYRPMILESYC
jgi:hypothetical protein